MIEIKRLTAADAGCWVAGHWGQYATATMIMRAQELGYSDAEVIRLAERHLDSMAPSDGEGLNDDEHEALSLAADEAEAWLNRNVAPDGYGFGWHDGEFFLMSDQDWEDLSY